MSNTHLHYKPEVTWRRGLRALEFTRANNMADVLLETVGEKSYVLQERPLTNVVPQHYVLIGRITEKTSRSMHFRKFLVVGWNGQWKWNDLTASLDRILLCFAAENILFLRTTRAVKLGKGKICHLLFHRGFSGPKCQVSKWLPWNYSNMLLDARHWLLTITGCWFNFVSTAPFYDLSCTRPNNIAFCGSLYICKSWTNLIIRT